MRPPLAVACRRHRVVTAAGKACTQLLKPPCAPTSTVSVARAFSYFSHLASPGRSTTVTACAAASTTLCARNAVAAKCSPLTRWCRFAAPGRICPKRSAGPAGPRLISLAVLTAHPTEVQRQSIRTPRHAIAELLARDSLNRALPQPERGRPARPHHPAVADPHAARTPS